jgi:hypothetical protein
LILIIHSLVKLGGNLHYTGMEVYLHIVMLKEEQRPRFYVGQAQNLEMRVLKQHSRLSVRQAHPSLHYLTMERAEWDVFVVLAYGRPDRSGVDENTYKLDELSMNIVEMFGSCWRFQLFRTVPLILYVVCG